MRSRGTPEDGSRKPGVRATRGSDVLSGQVVWLSILTHRRGALLRGSVFGRKTHRLALLTNVHSLP